MTNHISEAASRSIFKMGKRQRIEKRRRKEKHTIFQHFIKMLQVLHDDVAMLLQNCQSDEEVELATIEIGPEPFPQAKHVRPFKLAFVPDEEHAKEKEEVGGVCRLKMKIEGGIQ